MLTKSCVYAIRSIVYIAHNASKDKKVGIKAIAEYLDLPTPYLGKILQRLTKQKIILSVKGPNGGFYLTEKEKSVALIKIIEVIDGLEFFTSCGLGMHECSDARPCPLHGDFKIYRDGLWDVFNSKTINDLVISVTDGETFIQNLQTK